VELDKNYKISACFYGSRQIHYTAGEFQAMDAALPSFPRAKFEKLF
jgi:hypothetical protein